MAIHRLWNRWPTLGKRVDQRAQESSPSPDADERLTMLSAVLQMLLQSSESRRSQAIAIWGIGGALVGIFVAAYPTFHFDIWVAAPAAVGTLMGVALVRTRAERHRFAADSAETAAS